jgi:hypothetical protein
MCNTARCQTCQTYGSRINPLFEIAVDENEGVFQCADCLHTARVLQDQYEIDVMTILAVAQDPRNQTA